MTTREQSIHGVLPTLGGVRGDPPPCASDEPAGCPRGCRASAPYIRFRGLPSADRDVWIRLHHNCCDVTGRDKAGEQTRLRLPLRLLMSGTPPRATNVSRC